MKKCSNCNQFKNEIDFNKDSRRKDGLHNPCKLCRKSYRNNNKSKIKFRGKAYYASHKEKRKNYFKSDKGKIAQAKYFKSDKGKIALKKYFKSDKGKLTIAKQYAKRHRNLGFELLFDKPDSWLCPVDYHHISDGFVVAIPRFIHKQYGGYNHRERMKHIVEMLYGISYFIEGD